MTKTAQLLALAEAAMAIDHNENPQWYTADDIESQGAYYPKNARFIAACIPSTIKQMCLREQKLVELVRLQHEALGVCQTMADHNNDVVSYDACDKALEAFNKWEGK